MATFYRNDESRAERVARTRRVFEGRAFTLDGESLPDFAEWVHENGFTVPMREEFSLLGIGSEMIVGGGAGAEFVLRRVK